MIFAEWYPLNKHLIGFNYEQAQLVWKAAQESVASLESITWPIAWKFVDDPKWGVMDSYPCYALIEDEL